MGKPSHGVLCKDSKGRAFLRVRDSGSKPLIYFHHLLGFLDFDLRFLGYLSSHFDVIAPVLTLRPTLEEVADYTLSFTYDMGLKNYALGGVSFGGCMTLQHAAMSKRVESIYPVNPIVPSDIGSLRLALGIGGVLYKGFLQWGNGDFPDIFRPSYAGRAVSQILSNPVVLSLLIKNISRYSLPRVKDGSEVPGKMFCATKDAFFKFDEKTRRSVKRRFPNLSIVSFGEAHLAHHHNPKDLAEKIVEHNKRL